MCVCEGACVRAGGVGYCVCEGGWGRLAHVYVVYGGEGGPEPDTCVVGGQDGGGEVLLVCVCVCVCHESASHCIGQSSHRMYSHERVCAWQP